MALASVVAAIAARHAHGQSEADLAKELANPISSLISIPLQNNYDFDVGSDEGFRYTLNIQPVVPFDLNERWNLISRTIVPVVYQAGFFSGLGDQFGLGDTTQSLFFSPKGPTARGLIWGVGPAFLLPTATDDLLGTDQWARGSDRRAPEAEQHVDVRISDESPLVVRWRRHARRHERYVLAAIPEPHEGPRHVRRQFRGQLRLEYRKVDAAVECVSEPGGEHWRPNRESRWRREVLCRFTGRNRRELGTQANGRARLSKVSGDSPTAD
jgi:hypothetical protein